MASTSERNSNIKMLVATVIGSFFEIFDFLVFVFLTPIIARLFFPEENYFLATLFTFATVTVSYLLRPIGGIILGSMSDLYGRKTVFILSILLMSIPSLLISFLPTFAQIGYAAPILLIFLRILQGLSLGAEVPGGITYVTEKFHKTNYYFCLSFLTFGANTGVATAALFMGYLHTHTSEAFMYSYGFRIPFILGSILAIIGVYIRKSVTESEEFIELKKSKKISHKPFVTLLKGYKQYIVLGIVLALIVSITTSVFHIILPELFELYLHAKLQHSINVSVVGALILAVLSVFFAFLTRYISPIILARFGLIALLTIFVSSISLTFMDSSYLVRNIYSLVVLISIAISTVNGVFPGILVDLFPTEVRFSGVAICYNIAFVLGAGLTPLWTNSIMAFSHNLLPIFFICAGATCVTLALTFIIKFKNN